MDIWFNPANEIENALRAAAEALGHGEEFSPAAQPADPRFGDFQANGALPCAKRLKKNPRELGQAIAEKLALDPAAVSWEIAGPGFINFRLSPAFLSGWVKTYRTHDDLKREAGRIHDGKKVVVDFSSPNTAKQMHVGHIRSTVIGESISRLLAFCGADVIRDNHIGDWGTQFGIIIMAIKREGVDLDKLGDDPVAALEKLYKQGSALTKEDESALEEARAELAKLQKGDPENMRLWQMICDASKESFNTVYERLGVKFDETLGESFYNDKFTRVYDELASHGIAAEDQGALVVFHPEHPRFSKQPFIVRKSDGAGNYATTDLATALYRTEAFQAEEIVYVTDARQKDHFEQLFLTVEKWFAATGRKTPKLTHVAFGTILGEDGKAIKTRSGESIKLRELLDEAVSRAGAIVQEKNPELDEAERAMIAETVGLGAIRYADLMQNRNLDYVFSWQKLLSFEGNTAPYMLYQAARIHSIFRKAGIEPGESEEGASDLETDGELALARKLIGFSAALSQALSDLRPHFLCTYLYELAGAFSSFYNDNKVIVDEPDVKARRLALCARTLATIEAGLRLLGIEPLKRM